MKDPLRYFLDEGFGHLFYWVDDNGRPVGRMRWVTGFKEFIPEFTKVCGVNSIRVMSVLYPTSDNFFKLYGTEVFDKEAARRLIDKYNEEWHEVKSDVAAIQFAPEVQ